MLGDVKETKKSRTRVHRWLFAAVLVLVVVTAPTLTGVQEARLSLCGTDDPDACTDGGADIRIQGGSDSRLGFSAVFADLDGNPELDLVVGAPGEDRVYVFLGRKDPHPQLMDHPEEKWMDTAAADVIIQGTSGSELGFSLASLDGSLIIGAPATASTTDPGAAYVIPRGAITSQGIACNGPSQPCAIGDVIGMSAAVGLAPGDQTGYAVAGGLVTPGGPNGFVVSARAAREGRGVVYVFDEPAAGVAVDLDLETKIVGSSPYEGIGESLVVGDFVAGGPHDIGVGRVWVEHDFCDNDPATGCADDSDCSGGTCVTDNIGRVYVVATPTPATRGEEFAITDPGIAPCIIDGDSDEDFFGYSLAAGDYEGGSATDLAVGAIYADRPTGAGGLNAGAVYLFTDLVSRGGGCGVAGDLIAADPTTSHRIWGRQNWDELGTSLATGRFDETPKDDLVASARWHDRGFVVDEIDEGATYVILGGKPNGLSDWPMNMDCGGDATCSDPLQNPAGVDAMIVGGVHGSSTSDESGFAVAAGNFNGSTFQSGAAGPDDIVVSSIAHDRIYLLSLDQDPVAEDDSGTTDTDLSIAIDVLANDTDPNFDELTITLVQDPADQGGTVTADVPSAGYVTYGPPSGFKGTDTFTYEIDDGENHTATATVTVEVLNAAPVAVDDDFTTDEATAVPGDVLAANPATPDSDANNDQLTVAEVNASSANVGVQITLPSGALLTLNSDGTFTYDPNGQFESLAVDENDTDTFQYTIEDDEGDADTATVTVAIDGLNDTPTANDDSGAGFTTNEATPFTTGNVLTNDTDPDASDVLSVQSVDTTGTAGVVGDNGDGTFNYDPAGQFDFLAGGEQASDTFSYTVTDGNTGTDNAAVTVTVLGVNDLPVLGLIGNQSVDEGQTINVALSATDVEGDALAFGATGLPAFCALTDNTDGTGSVVCSPGFTDVGTYTVTVTVTDDGAPPASDFETFDIAVVDQNGPPELGAIGNQSVDEGQILNVGLFALDVEGDGLAFSATGLPAFCGLTDAGDGTGSVDCAPGFTDVGTYPVTVTVTDDGVPAASDSETIDIVVVDQNGLPELGAIGNQSVDEGQILNVALSATDVEGDGLAFSTTGLPGFCSLTDAGDGTGSLDCSPGFTDAGTYTVTVTVTDDGVPAASDSETFDIDVVDQNGPPELGAIGNQSVDEGQIFNVGLSATDVEGDGLAFSATGLPGFCTLTDNTDGTGSVDCAPGFTDVGTYTVTVTVTDDGVPAASDSETFDIDVVDQNGPPELGAIGNQSVDEGQTLIFGLSATDVEGDGLAFSATGLPGFCALTDNADGTGNIDCSPGFTDVGTYTVTVTVTDDGVPAASDSETLDIDVVDQNGSPELGAIGNQSVDEGQTLNVALSATDVEGDALAFSATGLPAFCTLTDNANGTGSVDCSPGFTDFGTYTVTVTVTDDGMPAASDSETFDITVVDQNGPPELGAIGNQSVDEGQTLSFGLSATDPESGALAFSATGLPGFCTLTDNTDGTGNIDCSPGFTDVGTYTVTVTVTDDGFPAASDSETFDIAVVDQNGSPELGAIGNQSVDEGQTLNVALSATDVEGDALAFSATGLPGFCTLTDNTDGTGSVDCAPGFTDVGTYTVTATVTDDGVPAASDSETFDLVVVDQNGPPELGAIGNQSVNEGQILNVALSATDPESDALAFSATGLPGFCTLTDNTDGTGSVDCAPGFTDVGNYTVTVTVTDDGVPAASDSETFDITVVDQNGTPELGAIGNQSVNEGQILNVALSATDPESDALVFSATGLPGFCTLTDNTDGTGSVDCAPGFTDVGNYTVTVTVTDDGVPAASDSETFDITVVDQNGTPELGAIGNQSVDEGQTLNVALSASDVEGDGLAFSTTGLPAFCTLTDAGDGTGSVDCAPGFTDVGTYTVTVTVTDDGVPAASDSETFDITVVDQNGPPELGAIGNQSVNEGQVLNVALSATDPESDALAFSATGLPAFCTLTDNTDGTGSVDCAPGFTDVGTFTVTVTVTDDGAPPASDSETFDIVVVDQNGAPELGAIGNQSVDEGQTLNVALSASDVEGDALAFSATGLPGFCSLTDNTDGTGSVDCAPGFTDVGTYTVTVTVTDDGVPAASDSETFDITVVDQNGPPELGAIGNQSVNEGQVLNVALSATDPESDALAFSATGLPAFCTLTDNTDGTGSVDCAPGFTDVGTFTVTVTVTDDGAPPASDSETFDIDVVDQNGPPELGAIGNQSVDEGQTLSFGLSATDPESGALAFSTTGLPGFCTLTDAGDGTGSVDCAPGFTDVGTYTVTVTVTDDGVPAASDSETFDITVVDQNGPPELGAIGNQSVDEGQTLSFGLSATDPENDGLTFSETGLPGFCALTDNTDGTGSVDCAPGFTDVGTYTVTVTVTDDGVPAESDSETLDIVVVEQNGPPELGAIGNQGVEEGQVLNIGLTATDPENDGLAFSSTGLPAFCTLTDNTDGTGSLDCSPGFTDEGTYTVTVTVTDDGVPAESDSETFDIVVGGQNALPELGAIGNQTVDEGQILNVSLSATDVEGDNLAFSTTGLPTFCTLTDNTDGTGSLDCAPGFTDVGTYTVTVTVTDDGVPAASDSETFDIVVVEQNGPPELGAIGNQSVNEGETLNFGLSATDPEGDGLTFSTTGLPTFCTLTDNGNGTGSVDCAPGFMDVGTFSVTVTVTDDGVPAATDSETFDIVVVDQNGPPELGAIGNQSVNEGQILNVALSATDADGDGLAFSATGLPAFCALTDNGDGTGSLDCAPGAGDAGTYTVTVTVTDDGVTMESDSETFDIVVNAPPTATITAPADASIFLEGQEITFTGSASDPEDGDLTASLAWSSNIDGSIGTGGSFSLNSLSIGTHTITASVTDVGGLTGQDQITITVDPNTAPVVTITAPADASSFVEGQEVTFTGTATDTEEGDLTANLAWTSDLEGTIGAGGSFSLSTLSIGTHVITASVTDIGGLTGDDQITITIDPNTAPTVSITAPADLSSFNTGDNVTFTGTASDTEDGDLTANLAWTSSIDGSIGTGGSFSLASLTIGTHTITASVTDVGGLSGQDQITITVNGPPTVAITSPTDGSAFNVGDNVTFTGTASDTEDGDLTANLAWNSDIDGAIGTGGSFSLTTLSVGTHVITASVTDSGGLSDNDQITITVNGPPTVTITSPADSSIFLTGATVDFDGTATDGEEGDLTASLSWNSDIDGAIGTGGSFSLTDLTIGTHLITASVTDSGGLSGQDQVTIIITDNEPPVVTITAPADMSVFNPGDDVAFTGTASDVEDGDLTANLAWTSDINGAIGTGGSFSLTTLSEGTHLITASVTDSASLPGQDQITITINAPPEVTITAPADLSIINSGDSVDFAGTATDDVDGDVTANLAWSSDIDGAIGTGGLFSTSSLTVGTHTITASVTDSGGLSGQDQITITINAPPTVTITAPADGSSFNPGDDVTFTGTASDPEDGDVTASLQWSSDIDGSIGSGGSFSINTLSLGTHTITATATDSNGHSGQSQITVIINQPPVAQDDFFTTNEATNVNGIVVVDNGNGPDTDPDGDPLRVVAVSGGPTPVIGTFFFLDSGALLRITVNGAFTYNPNGVFDGLDVGETATDTFGYTIGDGNGGQDSATVTITINGLANNDPPTVTITAPADMSVFNPGDNVTFTGTASDTEDGDITASLAWTSDIDGALGTGGSFSLATLSVGTHTITASVTDSGGLSGQSQITLTINEAPVVTITAPADGSAFDPGATVDFSGTATDDVDGDLTASLAWNSSIDGAIGTGGSFSLTTLTLGIHTITASVTDSGGLLGESQITVNITDNDPPTVTITAPADLSVFNPGDNVTFTGTALDTEDGDVTANLAWTSSIDGAIGTGGSFSLTTLSVGTHTITASVTDSGGLSGDDQITITINDAPTVTITSPADGLTFEPGETIDFSGTAADTEDGDLTANLAWASDIDGPIGTGGSFSLSTLTEATHTITASVTDSGGLSGQSQITVNIVMNQLPIAQDDFFTINEDSVLNGIVVVDNGNGPDTDPDGDPLQVVAVTGGPSPIIGSFFTLDSGALLRITVNGAFTYNPNDVFDFLDVGESAIDTFGYTIGDGNGGQDSATVTITINGLINNEIPVVTISTPANGASFNPGDTINFDGSATDVEDGDVTASLTWISSIDGVIGNGGTFSRDDLSVGAHTITASVTDSGGTTGESQITITINDTPTVTITAPADGSTFNPGDTVDFAGMAADTEDGDLTGILAWNSDIDGAIGTGGSFSRANLQVGTHTITASATDSGGLTGQSQITLTINDTPAVAITAPPDGSSAVPGDNVTFTGTAPDQVDGDLTANLAWSSDLDGAIGTGGSFSRNDLSLGTHTITASVTDSGGLTGQDQITLTINTPPVAQDDSFAVAENSTLNGVVLLDNGNGPDTDADGDSLQIVAVSGGPSPVIGVFFPLDSGALVRITINGAFTYDPNGVFDGLGAGESAVDTFGYTIGDGNGGQDSATVTITINGVASATGSSEPSIVAMHGSEITWSEQEGAVQYHLYRGDLAALRASGTYTQNSGAVPDAMQDCFVVEAQDTDTMEPAPGQVLFYLITADDGAAEGTLGSNGSGQERPNHNSCRGQ